MTRYWPIGVQSGDERLGLDPAQDVLRNGGRFIVHTEEFDQSIWRDRAVAAPDDSFGYDGCDGAAVANEQGFQVPPFVVPSDDSGVQFAGMEETEWTAKSQCRGCHRHRPMVTANDLEHPAANGEVESAEV